VLAHSSQVRIHLRALQRPLPLEIIRHGNPDHLGSRQLLGLGEALDSGENICG
jgi:hypothetical protein